MNIADYLPHRRTRLYICGKWDEPVYDSDTSDMHPDDFLLYGPHTELTAVVDIGTFRRCGIWSQVSRRKIRRADAREYLKYSTWWPAWPQAPVITAPPATAELRWLEPLSDYLRRNGVEDANLAITHHWNDNGR